MNIDVKRNQMCTFNCLASQTDLVVTKK